MSGARWTEAVVAVRAICVIGGLSVLGIYQATLIAGLGAGGLACLRSMAGPLLVVLVTAAAVATALVAVPSVERWTRLGVKVVEAANYPLAALLAAGGPVRGLIGTARWRDRA